MMMPVEKCLLQSESESAHWPATVLSLLADSRFFSCCSSSRCFHTSESSGLLFRAFRFVLDFGGGPASTNGTDIARAAASIAAHFNEDENAVVYQGDASYGRSVPLLRVTGLGC